MRRGWKTAAEESKVRCEPILDRHGLILKKEAPPFLAKYGAFINNVSVHLRMRGEDKRSGMQFAPELHA